MTARSITREPAGSRSTGVFSLSQVQVMMEKMSSAVIFDFYGTLAKWTDAERAYTYDTVFAAHGYVLEPDIRDYYFSRYDGVDHSAHSVDEVAYERWVRARLLELVRSCGVAEERTDALVDALRRADQGDMTAYPEAAETLRTLREAGVAVGVCSNWGWELDAFLHDVGLLELVDVSITSARVGCRKPHPNIYRHSVATLGVDPADVVFVGDSWEPDVRGPRRAGMTSVHLWREDEREGLSPPPLEPGDLRVHELRGVLPLVGLT
jgi:putative hydrolase of the HAD superfamily